MNPLRFLNVDLEIESRSDLAELKRSIGGSVIDLGRGPVAPGCFQLRFETVPEYPTADDTICAFCSCLEALSPKAKRAWRSAHRKVFDIGCEMAGRIQPSQFFIRNETLKRAAALGAAISVTVYPRQR